MNDFRIPPYSEVKLVFARKVLRDEYRDDLVGAQANVIHSQH
jgi:hypothetical protein